MTQQPDSTVLRKTFGRCPQCLRCVPAEVAEKDGKIVLEKTCSLHGRSEALISVCPEYYKDVAGFYFDVMRRRLPQRDYIVRLTERCNLDCPICLAGANSDILPDIGAEEITRMARGMRGKKIDLMGCEPTVMQDLPDIIRAIRRSGNIAALHTNGIAIEDAAYLKKLRDAGLDEVHLQFDGFDDEAYRVIRGRPMLESKLKAMRNLSDLGIPVDLVMTILAGVNEKEIPAVLEFGLKHDNVKEIFFLGCRLLGKAAGKFESEQLMPDQVIDMVAQATNERISRDCARRFQKLYFALLSIFGVRKCLYVQHYLLFRDRAGGYKTLDQVIDMPGLERALDRFRRRRAAGSKTAAPLFLAEAAPFFLKPGALALAGDFLALSLMMALGFNLRRAKRRSVMLGYITACDPHIYDAAVADYCGKGEISRDLGTQESGALANVLREYRWRNG